MAGIINITPGGARASYGTFRASDFVFATAATHEIITSCPTTNPNDAVITTFYVVFIQLTTGVIGSIQTEELYSLTVNGFTPQNFTKIINLPGIQVSSLATAQAIVANINTQITAYYNAL